MKRLSGYGEIFLVSPYSNIYQFDGPGNSGCQQWSRFVLSSWSIINAAIRDFLSSWNGYPLSSENNQLQQFCLGNDSESDSDDDLSSWSTVLIQLPTSQPGVEVSNLSFIPCILIHAQVKVLATQSSLIINQGYDLEHAV